MKQLKFLALMLLSCATFAACGSDDESKDNDPKPDPKPDSETIITYYDFTQSQTTMDVFNFTLYYFDENGEVKTESITETTWTKTIEFAKTDKCISGYYLAVEPKTPLNEDNYYDLVYNLSCDIEKNDMTIGGGASSNNMEETNGWTIGSIIKAHKTTCGYVLEYSKTEGTDTYYGQEAQAFFNLN